MLAKSEDEGDYNLIIRSLNNSDIKLKCEVNIYENVIIDEDVSYMMEYRWLTSNNQGVLRSINLDDYIDNR